MVDVNNYPSVLLEEKIIDAIADEKCNRKDVSNLYAEIIKMSFNDEVFNYPHINQSIMDRWSFSALQFIKERAWKIVENKKLALYQQ